MVRTMLKPVDYYFRSTHWVCSDCGVSNGHFAANMTSAKKVVGVLFSFTFF